MKPKPAPATPAATPMPVDPSAGDRPSATAASDVGVGCGCDEAPECTHSLYWWIGFKEGQKTLLLDQKDAAQRDGREATCFAIAALEPERLRSTEYKTGFIDAKNFALELVERPAAAQPQRESGAEELSQRIDDIWAHVVHVCTKPHCPICYALQRTKDLLAGQRESEQPEQALREALLKVRSYNVDILAGRINYRPQDHIDVIDAALSPQTDSLSTQQGGPQHG